MTYTSFGKTINQHDSRFKTIELLLLDVDGVLTNGNIFYNNQQGWTRTYHIHDGFGIKLMQKFNFPIGIISGGQSDELKERIRLLGIEHYVLGSEDKLKSMTEISNKLNIPFEKICFMGDELFDLPALRACGLPITVPNAVTEVRHEVTYITERLGGFGAVREVIDIIRAARGFVNPY
jgi:3-deoxy-D-manno-octulosonate 8-phosphate phosphatase (KDO 8-P phosphatase)